MIERPLDDVARAIANAHRRTSNGRGRKSRRGIARVAETQYVHSAQVLVEMGITQEEIDSYREPK
jgi:hypothetical protein